jgi:glycerophosphoryl diester phosphodiesterase
VKIIGHRGARGLAPENTIAGLQKALKHKVDEIEFDVRVTKDGIPVLHHGQKLRDTSGNHLDLADHSFEELKNHKPDLITLEAALETFATKVPLCIEVKRGEPTQPIAKIIRKYQHNRIFVGSKNQKTLRELHKLLPDVPKIVIEPWSGVKATYRARPLSTKLISMNQRFLWFGFISAMRRRGYELYAYTMNNPKKARRWAKYGLAGVVTDFPDRF